MRPQVPMIRRRHGAAIAAVIGLLALIGAPAGAQGYVPSPGAATELPVAEPGATIIIEAEGFLPNAPVELFVVEFTPSDDEGKSNEENLEDLSETMDTPLVPIEFASASAADASPAAFALATPGSATATFAVVTQLALPLGSTTTDANGNFRFEWPTPGFPEGRYGILATDGVNSALIRVQIDKAAFDAANGAGPGAGPGPGNDAGSGSLPQTGGVEQLPLRLGALLLAVGGVIVLTARYRRRSSFTVSG
jgi:hypothetical protein